MKIISLFQSPSALRGILCFIFLTLPLAADTLSRLRLEQSTDLAKWQSIAVTPEMIDESGRLVLPAEGAESFYRMLVELIQPPSLSAQPAPAMVNSGNTTTLSVTASGTGPFTYQWYQGAVGTTTTPVGTNSAIFTTPALTATTTYWVRVTNQAGAVDSVLATVTVATAPSIITQPVSTSISSGSSAILTVTATGTAPLSYQWYQGAVGATTTPVGTNSPNFTTPALNSTTTYWVRVSNVAGNVNSALVTVDVATPPAILSQPASATITSGQTATLTVVSTGTGPLTYQWYQGAVGVTTSPVGTNTASFKTPALTANTTSYWVRVSNAAGSVNSAAIFVTTVGSDLIFIPAGVFRMGRTSGDADSDAPPVDVNVSAFYIGKYEVTKAQWETVRAWGLENGYPQQVAGNGVASNHPIQRVGWGDVINWCNARSEMEGLTPCYYNSDYTVVRNRWGITPIVNWNANGYRLPTEAEWEKAARGGTSGKRFPWGDDTISHDHANYYAASTVIGYGDVNYDLSANPGGYHPLYIRSSSAYTSPVGSFAANGYGLHDTAGNVWEWCWDEYGSKTYITGVTDPRGAGGGINPYVIRGGSWADRAIYCPSGRRNSSNGGAFDNLGFRIVRSSNPDERFAPSFETQPASVTINSGRNGSLSVVASGTAPLAYQWYQGAVGTTTTPVGTNSASFTTPALTATTTYWVRVSNQVGSMDSAPATVSVAVAP